MDSEVSLRLGDKVVADQRLPSSCREGPGCKALRQGREINKKYWRVIARTPAGQADSYDVIMPRYFFNTRIGTELMLDPEGEELRDPDHAWKVARTTIREILKTEGGEAGLLNAILEVTDDDGEIVLEFPFAEAILDGSGDSGTKH
jgi:hypothetical protein